MFNSMQPPASFSQLCRPMLASHTKPKGNFPQGLRLMSARLVLRGALPNDWIVLSCWEGKVEAKAASWPLQQHVGGPEPQLLTLTHPSWPALLVRTDMRTLLFSLVEGMV